MGGAAFSVRLTIHGIGFPAAPRASAEMGRIPQSPIILIFWHFDVTRYAELLMQVNEKGSMVISAMDPQSATTGARENQLESNSMQWAQPKTCQVVAMRILLTTVGTAGAACGCDVNKGES